VLDGGAALELLLARMRGTAERAATAGGHAGALGTALERYIDQLEHTSGVLSAEADRTLALANATIYLEACGHVVIAWLWLEQLLVVADKEGDFYDGKRQAATYFFRYELPRVGQQFELLGSLDETTVTMRSEWF
jgi:hypothetical protein